MDMTVDNPVKYHVELVERLWSQGWAAFYTQSAGPGALADCDVIALRDGKAVALNVEVLEWGASAKNVSEENDELIKTKRRADKRGFSEDDSLIIGHAVMKQYDGEWYYADIDRSKVRGSEEYKHLNEVVY